MALTDRDRRALMMGGGLVLAVVLYRLLLSPLLAGWAEARAEAAVYTQRLAQLEDRLDRRDTLQRRLRETYGPAITQPLPTLEDARVRFPQAVQEALASAQLQPQQIEVQGVRRVRGVPGVSNLSLRVRSVAPPQAIPAALNALRSAGLIVVVESVDLSMAQPNQREQWQLLLTLSTPTLDAEVRR